VRRAADSSEVRFSSSVRWVATLRHDRSSVTFGSRGKICKVNFRPHQGGHLKFQESSPTTAKWTYHG